MPGHPCVGHPSGRNALFHDIDPLFAGKSHTAVCKDRGRVQQRQQSPRFGVELDERLLGTSKDDGLRALVAQMCDGCGEVAAAGA